VAGAHGGGDAAADSGAALPIPLALANRAAAGNAPSKDLHPDRGDGVFVIDEAAMPRHVEPPLQRMLKLALHAPGIWP
jgi:hypothetical protein